MAAVPPGYYGTEDEKVVAEPVSEKPDDVQNEFETSSQVNAGDKAASASRLTDDAHTKALTRKLLWKLDTRYVLSSNLWGPFYSVLNTCLGVQNPARSRRSLPLFFPRPDQCRQRQNPRA